MVTKKCLFLVLSLVLLFSARLSFATRPSDFGLKEGDLISAIFSDDPDVYIINEHGYKRLFLNPEIFKFYKHLGGFANVKLVTPEIRDSFPISGLFRNCEAGDSKVYGIDIEGEDQGELRWVNTSGDQAVKDDPDFFKKVFCINKKEFDWYPKATAILHSVKEVPKYDRVAIHQEVATEEKLKINLQFKEEGKVLICHFPAETASRSLEIFIAPSAVRAHLEHGDKLGSCRIILPTFSPTPTPLVNFSPVPTVSPSHVFTPTQTPLVTISPSPMVTTSPSYSFTPLPTSTSTSAITTTPIPSATASSSFTPTPSPSTTPASLPQSPASVTASYTTGQTITVSWTASASRYNIYLGLNGGAYSFWSTNQINPSFGYHINDYASLGTIYRFKIYGCNSDSVTCSSTGTESNAVTYGGTPTPISTPTPTPAPAPPSGFTAQLQNGTEVFMYWSTVGNATSYKVERFISGASAWVTVATPGSGITHYRDTGLAPGTYYYFARACNAYGCSNASNTGIITVSSSTPTPTPIPTPPQGFITQLQNGTNVWMNWYAVSGATTYRAERFTSGSPAWVTIAEVGGISTNYTDVGLASGTHYYHVRACNSSGCSNISNETIVSVGSSATPAPTATVSFDNFSRNLTLGSSGPDVQHLQALLVNEVNYPANLITGYFGSITREAVKRLQEKYGVQPLSGYFGAITRKMLNEFISH